MNTRQIINRALALTDFNDDFFIGNVELTNLLNDCWQHCYELLCNKGDKTFVKTITVKDGQHLPKDFYKILEVSKKKNLLLKNQDYDIINNIIHFNNVESADLTYYPAPKPLCLKANDTDLMDYNNVITFWEDGFVTATGLFSENGEQLKPLNLNNVTYLSNGYISNSGIFNYSDSSSSNIKCIKGNTITYDNVVLKGFDSVTSVTPLAVITNDSKSFFYVLATDEDGYVGLYNEDCELVISGFMPKTLFCREDGLYFIKDSKLYKILGKEIEEFQDVYNCIGILDETHASYELNGIYYIRGYGIDSELDVPNSAFWSYFSYSIAISFCNVVQRDSEHLQTKLEEVKKTFLQSLDIDSNSCYQIRDTTGSYVW